MLREVQATEIDSGLESLTLLLHFHGIAADSAQIRHRFGSTRLDTTDMLRCAREFKLRARAVNSNWPHLAKLPLPAIVEKSDGSFAILAKITSERALIQPPTSVATLITRAEFEAQWTGRIVLMTRRAALGDLARRFDLAWFFQATTKYRRIFTEVLVASFCLQLFALVTPLFFQVVTDKVLAHQGFTTLDVLAIGLVSVSTFESLLTGLRTYIFAHTCNRIDVELGARLFQHLVALPISYFEARRAGDSVARVRELETIRNFLTGSSLTLVIDLIFTFVFLAVMFYYSPTLAFIVIGSFPFYIALSAGVTPVFRRRLEEKFERNSENQSFLVESVTAIETIKAMAVEPQLQRRWEEQLASYTRSSFNVLSLGNWASQAVQYVSKIVTALTLYFGAHLVIEGKLTIGELVAFNMLAGRVAQPVLRLAQVYQDFHQVRISIARLGDILNSTPEPTYSPTRAALPAIRGDIQVEHVTFRYRPDGPEILKDVTLRIPAGQMVGIVGPSGSGKSTLTKLVQRLYVPEGGRVLVDGIDLGMVDVAWLRRQVGGVLQENVLFNRSIRDNIAFVDPALPMDRIITAAQLAGAHDFILELPSGYDTIVGERGASLSGGQRQRIAIARALISDPRILIFDEATSALDYESERVIQANMRRIAQGRTVLVIAHRLSTVRSADRIITIERGRVVEEGTHNELVRSGGRYARLHKLQAGVEEIA